MILAKFINYATNLIHREIRYKDTSTQKNLVSIIFDKKKVISVGVNYSMQPHGSIHAEMDAFRTLPKNHHKIQKKIFVFVTRFTLINNTIHLKLSKPCLHCIQYMDHISKIKNYTIKKIFYTDEYQNIVHTDIQQLYLEKNPYISTFFRINKNNSLLLQRKIHL